MGRVKNNLSRNYFNSINDVNFNKLASHLLRYNFFSIFILFYCL